MKNVILAAAIICLAMTAPLKPRVLIIGDSISMGYTPFVHEILDGSVGLTRPEGNCGGSLRGMELIDEWLALGDGSWDVIHFNFGLHDLKHVDPDTGKDSGDPSHPSQQTPEQYAANLEYLIGRMKATGARLVFATTTPFNATQPMPFRDSVQVAVYNAAALDVCRREGVAVNDLCGYVLANPKMMRPDNVHFYPADSRALAGQVASAILKELDVRALKAPQVKKTRKRN